VRDEVTLKGKNSGMSISKGLQCQKVDGELGCRSIVPLGM
jgi:hypothetical protein